MNGTSCSHETAATNAARTGCWDASTIEHVQTCSYCREIVQSIEWMAKAAGTEEQHFIPDAEKVWLNARMRAIQEARERALRPVLIMEFAVRVAWMLSLAAGLVWTWFKIQSAALHALGGAFTMPQAIIASIAAFGACLATLLFVRLVQPMLVEE